MVLGKNRIMFISAFRWGFLIIKDPFQLRLGSFWWVLLLFLVSFRNMTRSNRPKISDLLFQNIPLEIF